MRGHGVGVGEVTLVKESGHMDCDMEEGCTEPVTHIGEKGYVYCARHAVDRRHSGYERTRRMRAWELRMLRNGQPLPSYRPIAKPVEVRYASTR